MAEDPRFAELTRLGASADLVADARAGLVDADLLLRWAKALNAHKGWVGRGRCNRCKGPVVVTCDTCERCLAAEEAAPVPRAF
jgi:hypothetical protein